jgi:hypothetical protein
MQTKLRFVPSRLFRLGSCRRRCNIDRNDFHSKCGWREQAGDRPVRASASLQAICPAVINDWQFVKISRRARSAPRDSRFMQMSNFRVTLARNDRCHHRTQLFKIPSERNRRPAPTTASNGCDFFHTFVQICIANAWNGIKSRIHSGSHSVPPLIAPNASCRLQKSCTIAMDVVV